MAMTKKERAEMDALRDELRLAKALRFTEDVKPDVPPPDHFHDGLSKGWTFHWYPSGYGDSFRIERACSSSIYHGIGDDTKTTTQQPMWLYSTRLLALRACRRAAEKGCAKWLAEIDAAIEAKEKGDS